MPEIMRKERRWATYAWPDTQPRRTDGRPASATDPYTWASYPQVRAFKSKGYMLGGNIGCVEIDRCLVRGADSLHPRVEDMIAPLREKTYVEYSPDERGLRIFGLMNEDAGWRREWSDGISLTLHSRERFVVVTGQRWSNTSQLGYIRQHFDFVKPVLH